MEGFEKPEESRGYSMEGFEKPEESRGYSYSLEAFEKPEESNAYSEEDFESEQSEEHDDKENDSEKNSAQDSVQDSEKDRERNSEKDREKDSEKDSEKDNEKDNENEEEERERDETREKEEASHEVEQEQKREAVAKTQEEERDAQELDAVHRGEGAMSSHGLAPHPEADGSTADVDDSALERVKALQEEFARITSLKEAGGDLSKQRGKLMRLQAEREAAAKLLAAKQELVEQQLLLRRLEEEEAAAAALQEQAVGLDVEEEVQRRMAMQGAAAAQLLPEPTAAVAPAMPEVAADATTTVRGEAIVGQVDDVSPEAEGESLHELRAEVAAQKQLLVQLRQEQQRQAAEAEKRRLELELGSIASEIKRLQHGPALTGPEKPDAETKSSDRMASDDLAAAPRNGALVGLGDIAPTSGLPSSGQHADGTASAVCLPEELGKLHDDAEPKVQATMAGPTETVSQQTDRDASEPPSWDAGNVHKDTGETQHMDESQDESRRLVGLSPAPAALDPEVFTPSVSGSGFVGRLRSMSKGSSSKGSKEDHAEDQDQAEVAEEEQHLVGRLQGVSKGSSCESSKEDHVKDQEGKKEEGETTEEEQHQKKELEFQREEQQQQAEGHQRDEQHEKQDKEEEVAAVYPDAPEQAALASGAGDPSSNFTEWNAPAVRPATCSAPDSASSTAGPEISDERLHIITDQITDQLLTSLLDEILVGQSRHTLEAFLQVKDATAVSEPPTIPVAENHTGSGSAALIEDALHHGRRFDSIGIGGMAATDQAELGTPQLKDHVDAITDVLLGDLLAEMARSGRDVLEAYLGSVQTAEASPHEASVEPMLAPAAEQSQVPQTPPIVRRDRRRPPPLRQLGNGEEEEAEEEEQQQQQQLQKHPEQVELSALEPPSVGLGTESGLAEAPVAAPIVPPEEAPGGPAPSVTAAPEVAVTAELLVDELVSGLVDELVADLQNGTPAELIAAMLSRASRAVG